MWLGIVLWGRSLWGPPNDVTDVGQYLRLVNVAEDRPLGPSLWGTLNDVSDVGQYLGLVDVAGEWFLKSEPGAIFWQRACSRHERRQ